MRLRISLFIAFCCIYTAGSIHAAEIDYGIGLQLGSYENIERIEVSPGKEVSESLLGFLSWNENTVDLTGSVNIQTEFTNYKENFVDDTNQADLTADFIWIISPNHYEWQLSNIYTHTAIDSTLTNTPSNRQYVNSFSTGPNLIWRFGAIDKILISPRFEDYKFEESVLSNRRLNNVIEWVHTPSKSISLGLDNRVESTKYTSSAITDTDYNQVDINANFSYIKNKNIFESSIGISRLESNSFETQNNSQYNISINHQRTSTSNIELEASKTVTDTSRSVSTVTIDDVDILTTSNDLFNNKALSLIYNKKLKSIDLILNVSRNEEDYFNQNDLDRDIDYARLSSRWINTSNSSFLFSYAARKTTYTDTLNDRLDDDIDATVAYQYQTNKNINYRISLTKLNRDSNTENESFEDKIILFSIIYSTNNRNI